MNTNYRYDSLSRLLSVLHQTGGTTIDGASYTYDVAGNRMAKGNYLNGATSNYTYDPLYELTHVTQGASTTESYSYDAVGSRLSSSGVSPNSYNSSNGLTSTPSGSYTYDANGNTSSGVSSYSYNSSNELISMASGSYTYDDNGNTLADASGKSYAWDFENCLTQLTLPTDGGTVAFKYDPFGRRIQKSGPNGTTNYLYDGMNGIEEMDSAGNELDL